MNCFLFIFQLYLLANAASVPAGEQKGDGGPIFRYMETFSFKPPFKNVVPNWSTGGATEVLENTVRLTQSTKSQRGYIWSETSTTFEFWQIELQLNISGGTTGGDGLVIKIIIEYLTKS